MTNQELNEMSEAIALYSALYTMEILKEADLYNSDTQCALDEKGLLKMGSQYGIEKQKEESLIDFRNRLRSTVIRAWKGQNENR